MRLDRLATLGRYGALLLGFDDVSNADDLSKPASGKDNKLLYVKPLSEKSATITKWDTQPSSPRYSLPVLYQVCTTDPAATDSTTSATTMPTRQIPVHYSRIIHVPGEQMESEVEGIPFLEAPYNRLEDLEKIVGGSAEMFWRGARPGYKGKVDEDFTLSTEDEDELEDQLYEFENDLRRFLMLRGISLDTLDMQVADPGNHVLVQVQMISAVTGIPQRILLGSERGELASSEDRMEWLERVQERRETYAELQIIRPFISACSKYGVLPKPKDEYRIKWSDIFAPSEKDRAAIGQTRASAIQSYLNNPVAETVIPPEVFYDICLGLSKDDVERIKKIHETTQTTQLSEEATAAAAANPANEENAPPPTVHKES